MILSKIESKIEVNVGVDGIVPLEIATSALPVNIGEDTTKLWLAPLSDYHSQFEELYYSGKRYDDKVFLLESLQANPILDVIVLMKKNKTCKLYCSRYPLTIFYLTSLECDETQFESLKPGHKLQVQFLELKDKLVYTTIPIDTFNWKALQNQQVDVIVNRICENSIDVLYEGRKGTLPAVRLFNGYGWRKNYSQLIGTTIKAYLTGMSDKNILMFSQNSLIGTWSNEAPSVPQFQEGDIIKGIPISFNDKSGLFICHEGSVYLLPRGRFGGADWEKLYDVFTLGKEYDFKVYKIDTEKRKVLLTLSDKEEILFQPQKLITEVGTGLELNTEIECTIYQVLLKGVILRHGKNGGFMTNQNSNPLIYEFAYELMASGYLFRAKVFDFYGKYSFEIKESVRRALIELQGLRTITMRVIAIKASGQVLLAHGFAFAKLELSENIWKIGDVLTVLIHFLNFENMCLEVSALQKDNLWYQLKLSRRKVISNVTILEPIPGEGYKIGYKEVTGRLLTDNQTFAVGQILNDLVVVHFSLILRELDLCIEKELADAQTLPQGKQIVEVVRMLGLEDAICRMNGQYVILRFTDSNVFLKALYHQNASGFQVEAINDVTNSKGAGVLLSNASVINGHCVSDLNWGTEVEVQIEDCLKNGYVVSYAGLKGWLPKSSLDLIDDAQVIGNRLRTTIESLPTNSNYTLQYDSLSLTNYNWKELTLYEGDVVELPISTRRVGYLLVACQGIYGKLPNTSIPSKYLKVLQEGDILPLKVENCVPSRHSLVFSYKAQLIELLAQRNFQEGDVLNSLIFIGATLQDTIVIYQGILACIPNTRLGWCNPELEVRLLQKGEQLHAKVEAINEETCEVTLNRQVLYEDPWGKLALQPDAVVQAKVQRLDGNEILVEVDGILAALSHKSVCHLLGKMELIPVEDCPYQAGEQIEVKVMMIKPEKHLLILDVVCPLPSWPIGENLQLSIAHVHPQVIELHNYLNMVCSLSIEEMSWLPLIDLTKLGTINQKMEVRIIDVAMASIKTLLVNPLEHFCIGYRFLAKVVYVGRELLTMCYQDNYFQLSTPDALHIPLYVIERCPLNSFFNLGQELTVKVVELGENIRLQLDNGVRPGFIDDWHFIAETEDWIILRHHNCWGKCLRFSEEIPSVLRLAIVREDECGFYELKLDLNEYIYTMIGQVFTCRPTHLEEGDLYLTSSEISHVCLKMPIEEWSWTRMADDNDLCGETFPVKVIAADEATSTLYVSRRALEEDNRYISYLCNEAKTTVRLKSGSKNHFIVEGTDFLANLPFEECGWVESDDYSDRFKGGELLMVMLLKYAEQEKPIVSIRQLDIDPWSTWLPLWEEGKVYPFRIECVTAKHLFLRYRELLVPLKYADVYWQVGRMLTTDFQENQLVNAKLLALNLKERIISLSVREVHPLDVTNLPKVGQVVEGKVVNIVKQRLTLWCDGFSMVIPAGEVTWGVLRNKEMPYQIGDRVKAIISLLDLETNKVEGSIRKLIPQNGTLLPEGEICKVTVVNISNTVINVSYGDYRGILPFTESSLSPEKLVKIYPIGSSLWALLSKVEYDANRLQFSLIQMNKAIKEGEVGDAKVTALRKDGIRVIYKRMVVKIPANELSWIPQENLLGFFAPNDLVKVKVIKFNPDLNELKLSMRQVTLNPWYQEKIQIGTVLIATTIVAVSEEMIYVSYHGNLVRIDREELFWKADARVRDHYKVGDLLDVKIISYDTVRKISCGSVNVLKIGTEDDSFHGIEVGSIEDFLIETVTSTVLLGTCRGIALELQRQDLYWIDCFWFQPDMVADFRPGMILKVKVIEVNRHQGILKLSYREMQDNPFIINQVDDVVMTEIIGYYSEGYLVRWDKGIGTVRESSATRQQRAMKYIPELRFILGEKMLAQIKKVDQANSSLFLNFVCLYKNPFEHITFQVGDIAKASVRDISWKGVLVQYDNYLRAFMPAYEMFNTVGALKKSILSFQSKELQELETKILDLDAESRLLKVLPAKKLQIIKFPYEEGQTCEVYIMTSLKGNLIVRTKDDYLGCIEENEIDYKVPLPFEYRQAFDENTPRQAKYLGINNLGVLRFSLKALLPSPFGKYLDKRNNTFSGRIIGQFTRGFYVELDDAIGRIMDNNLSWQKLDHWESFFKIGDKSNFHAISARDNMVVLSCLTMPFDANNQAIGILVSEDNNYVFADIKGIKAVISKRDAALLMAFTDNLGMLHIPIGAKCLLVRKQLDTVKKLIHVKFVKSLK